MHCKISKELSVNGKKCVDGWSPKINHSQVLVLCTVVTTTVRICVGWGGVVVAGVDGPVPIVGSKI